MKVFLEEAKQGFVNEGLRRGFSQDTIDAYLFRATLSAEAAEKKAMEKTAARRQALVADIKSRLQLQPGQ